MSGDVKDVIEGFERRFRELEKRIDEEFSNRNKAVLEELRVEVRKLVLEAIKSSERA